MTRRTNIKTAAIRNYALERGSRFFIELGLTVLVLLIVGLIIYRDFAFGGKTLLYKDIGSDSINISYPFYVLLSDYLRRVGIPSWSFQVGMGQNIFPQIGTVMVTPVVWFAKRTIATSLVYQHLLYLVITGGLFARFLANRGLSFSSSLLGAMLLSFSAYMCMGSCWYFHANELVCFTFLLFAAEKAAGTGQWLYLALAVMVVGIFSVFHLFFCALFLSFYIPVRLIDRFPGQLRCALSYALLLGGAAFLGVGLTAFASIGSFYSLLNSPRGFGPASLAGALSSVPVFWLESPLHYITAVLRPFANDMLGTGSDFRGWQNYLEAPMTYCGLLALVLVPQAFTSASRRTRVIYALLLGVLVSPTVFPWFRYLLWGFQGDYYRTLSLFWIFGFISLAMIAFSHYGDDLPLNLWTLGLTIIALVVVLYFPAQQLRVLVDQRIKLAATIFILSYAGLLIAGQLLKRQRVFSWIIIAFVVAELAYFDEFTVGGRPTVTKQELTERVGYNDETMDAVRDIQSGDSGFFRITKTWGSGLAESESLNDAMVFGYFGTASYNSFNNLNYIRFLWAVDALTEGGDVTKNTRLALGVVRYPLLSTFACEKYVLTDHPEDYETIGLYELIGTYGKISAFRNHLSLPFGLMFNRWLPDKLFLELSRADKAEGLLHAVVLADEKGAHGLSEMTFDELQRDLHEILPADQIPRLRQAAFRMRSFRETEIVGKVRAEGNSILVLQTPFDPGWRALVDEHAAPLLRVDAGLLGVFLEAGDHDVKLRYIPAFLGIGTAITLGSLVVLSLLLWKWPRLRSIA